MDDLTKGLRELIRVTMRERGIRHKSDRKIVSTLCYAEHPEVSVEFEGPIIVYCNLEEAIIIVDAYGFSKTKSEPKYNCSDNRSPYFAEVAPIETLKIDIARPDMTDVLGQFLDKHIDEDMKRPEKYKKLVDGWSEKEPYKWFVPSGQPRRKKKRKIIRTAFRELIHMIFGIASQDFYWEQAIKRHFRVSDDELAEIKGTVGHIRLMKKDEVEKNTELIIDQ